MKISIIDLEVSNLYSITNAVKYLDYDYVITNSKKEIENSDCIILPGVGSFPYAISQLKKKNIYQTIIKDVKKGKPIIGICLGFQLLFTNGEEFKNINGLNLIDGAVKILPKKDNLPIPHVGWNNLIKSNKKSDIFFNKKDYFYFVHSYYAEPNDKKVCLSYTKYGNYKFCSSILLENIFGFQFHPEKSGRVGLNLLSKALKNAKKI
tara:strand:+ start:708 stop:1328 length:621 start_codon:yes stop_codon:yes gene_type:complete